MLTPFPVQQQAIESLLESLSRFGACLNASDTGTGKTLMSVEMCRRLPEPGGTLVVCPKAVRPSWQRAFEQQGVDHLGVTNWEKLRTGRTEFGRWKDGHKREFVYDDSVKAVIFDEVHRAKGRSSQNSKLLKSARGRWVICCSATASSNPSEMEALGYVLGLHRGWDFVTWARSYGCTFDDMGKLVFDQAFADFSLGQLHRILYPHRAYRVRRVDLADHFSETSIITEPVDFDDGGGIQKIYELMEDELQRLEETRSFDATGAEGLTAQLRARQEVELLKVPVMVQFTKDYLEDGMAVCCFFNFKESVLAYRKAFKFEVPAIEGGQTEAARQGIIDAFAEDKHRVICCNLQAGGLGLNLHDIRGDYPRGSLISPSWNEKDLLQVLGRIDRAGAKTNTIQRIFFAAGTVEEDIRLALHEKLYNLTKLHRMDNETDTPNMMEFDLQATWATAQKALIKNSIPEASGWGADRVERGTMVVLVGPNEEEFGTGEKRKITNAIRKASGIDTLTWRYEVGVPSRTLDLEPDVQSGDDGFLENGAANPDAVEVGMVVHDIQGYQGMNVGVVTGKITNGVNVRLHHNNEDSFIPWLSVRFGDPGLNEKPLVGEVECPKPVEEKTHSKNNEMGTRVHEALDPHHKPVVMEGKPMVFPKEADDSHQAHARYSPSSLEYFERCPSYTNRDDEGQDMSAAEAGTRFHEMVETGDFSIAESDEERHYAELTIAAREDLLRSHGLTPSAREDHREIRLTVKLALDETYGTVDHLAVSKGVFEDGTKMAVMVDYKYGLTPVTDAEINAQMTAYAIGVFQKFPDVGTIAVYILLPRQGKQSYHVFTKARDYPNMMLRIQTIISRAKELHGEVFFPSPSLCEWCGNIANCAALANHALLIASRYDEGEFFRIPDIVHGSQLDDPEIVGKLRHITPILDRWIDGINRRAITMLTEEGAEMEGIRVVHSKRKRSISNPMLAYNLLVNPKNVGQSYAPLMTHDEFMACVDGIGITKLLEAIGDKYDKGNKQSGKESWESYLRSQGALSGGEEFDTFPKVVLDRKHHKPE